jgi:hypothetical protein
LNDFIAEKYPGTEKSYSSFESKVTIQDSSEVFDARIYMNNILDYEGYRFFLSFDPDEKGTVLSVSHDFGEQLLLMLVILCYFCYDVNYVYKTLSLADLQKN